MKKFLFVIWLIGLVGMLTGCYIPQQTQPPVTNPFTIEVKVDKPAYRIGEKMVIIVRASQDCYLSLYDTSTIGEVTQVFPNKYAPDNKLQGGVIYRIPTQSDKFDWLVQGPAGIEKVRAVGTTQNVNFSGMNVMESPDAFPKIQQPSDQFNETVNQKLIAIPSGGWAENSITFQVTP